MSKVGHMLVKFGFKVSVDYSNVQLFARRQSINEVGLRFCISN